MNVKIAALIVFVTCLILGIGYTLNLKSENTKLSTQNAELAAKLSTQNAAIEQMEKDFAIRDKNAQEKLAEAKIETEKAKKSAKIIYKAKPSVPGDDCKSALNLINGG